MASTPCSQTCVRVVKLKELHHGKQRRTRKDQAGIHCGYRPLLHHQQEQEDDARENVDHEIRPEGSQARGIQRDQAQVSWSLAANAAPKKKPRIAGLFFTSSPQGYACAARSFIENCCSATMPLSSARRHQACRSAASCSRDWEVFIHIWRSSSRMVTILSRTGWAARTWARCGRAAAGTLSSSRCSQRLAALITDRSACFSLSSSTSALQTRRISRA